MTMSMKLLIVLFVIILAALLILVLYFVVTNLTGKSDKPERKWTDPKFHD